MPASSLDILINEKKVEDLIHQKTGAKAFIKAGCNLLAFMGFVALFTGLALSEPLALHRSFEAYLRARFDDNAAMRLAEVNTIEDFYNYWNRSFIPAIYSNETLQYTFPGAALQTMLKVDGDAANNRLFGMVRVRMQKVVSEANCVESQYLEYFTNCYPPFSEGVQDTANFGPEDVVLGAAFKYTAPDGTGSWDGTLASYPAGGFLEKMDVNYTGSIELVKELKAQQFVTAASRVIFFEFTIYNLNMGMYAVCQITFEISPMGAWIKTMTIDMLDQRHMKALGDGGFAAWMFLIMEAILVIFVFRYLAEECSEFIGTNNVKTYNPCKKLRIKWDYFTDGWNVIDWTNLILIFIVLILRIQNWGVGGEAIENVQSYVGTKIPVTDYCNLHVVVGNVNTIRSLTAFNAVLTWFKAVKYINILPYISTFMETMALSWQFLAGFAAVFFTTFIGFCLSYSTAFGERISDFRTVPKTFNFLLRSFIGNADMSLVYDANPVIGSILIVLFVVGMIFVIMNLFYAILISTLSEARQTQELAQKEANAKFKDKIIGFFETVARALQLQQRMRGCFPGLYSRMKQWEKNRIELEKERDDQVLEKERAKMPESNMEKALGAASPNFGRRKAARRKTEADLDEDEPSDVESEPDLGKLKFKEQLEPPPGYFGNSKKKNGEEAFAEAFVGGLVQGMGEAVDNLAGNNEFSNAMNANFPQKENVDPAEQFERDEYAKEKVLEATGHIVDTVIGRCRGARQLVLSEMGDARLVLQDLGSVLEVLGRRARSLEAQQELVLPPEAVARVKDEMGEEF